MATTTHSLLTLCWKWSGRLSWFWVVPLALWIWAAIAYTEHYPALGAYGGVAYGEPQNGSLSQRVGVLFVDGSIEFRSIQDWIGEQSDGMLAAGMVPQCARSPSRALANHAFLASEDVTRWFRLSWKRAIQPEHGYPFGAPYSYLVHHEVLIEEYQPLSTRQRTEFRQELIEDWASTDPGEWWGWARRSTQDAMNQRRLDLLLAGDGQTRVKNPSAWWKNAQLEVVGWLTILLFFRFLVFPLQGSWRLTRYTYASWRRWRSPVGRCATCGYDLTGLESDRCPECGAATQPA